MRECQLEHAVVERITPVDQMVNDIAVRLERQHTAHDMDVVDDVVRELLNLRELLKVVQVDRLVELRGEIIGSKGGRIVSLCGH